MTASAPMRRLKDVTRIRSGGTPLRSRPNYWSPPTVPWVTTSEIRGNRIFSATQAISVDGLSGSSAKIFPAGTVLIAMYGQGATRGRTAILDIPAATNQACAALETSSELESEYLFQVLQASYSRIRGFSNVGGQDNLSAELIGAIKIPVPALAEQRKIAEILRTWDDAIDSASRTKLLRSTAYASVVNDLAGATTQSLPLGRTTREITERNTADRLGRSSVMGVSNSRGIVPMRAQTIATNLTRYQVLPPRGFAYNPMRIDVGSIAMSRLDHDVIVSPDYVLFECDEASLLPEYLDHVLATDRWRHDVSAGASGSVRTRTYYADLAAIRIHQPSVGEQRRITGVLDSMRDEIALLDRHIQLLREQKRGLMQKLLTGEIRVAGGDSNG